MIHLIFFFFFFFFFFSRRFVEWKNVWLTKDLRWIYSLNKNNEHDGISTWSRRFESISHLSNQFGFYSIDRLRFSFIRTIWFCFRWISFEINSFDKEDLWLFEFNVRCRIPSALITLESKDFLGIRIENNRIVSFHRLWNSR